MRTLILILVFGFGLFSSRFAADGQAQVQVTLSWNPPSSSNNIVGYHLAWGTNSGVYFATNIYPAAQTSGTISNLAYGTLYYIAVSAFAKNGQISPFCGEITYSSNAPPETTEIVSSGDLPPPPPSGQGKAGSGKPPPGGSGAGTSAAGGSSSGSGSGSSAAASSTNITQAQIWGIPPVLNLAVSNGQLNLNIGGTAGATVQLQSTTNPTAPFSWTTITNVALTNIAPMETNAVPGQPQDAIDLAYVPAAQIAPLPTTTSSARMQFFRVVMPYDYIILAGLALLAKGYTARLVVVNMPGLNDDACYVSQAGSYIHYSQTNSVLQLAGAGSTIRQIATTLANSLNLDWTTASEFTYSNGMGQILATVVEADPASSDPVAGQNPTSSIVINF